MGFSRRLRVSLIVAVLFLAVGSGFIAYKMRLPRPQGAFSDGQPAPDFTLNDQNGSPFRLSEQRGKTVLLIFYRGYW